jgi:SAM-dependent methyltransferase
VSEKARYDEIAEWYETEFLDRQQVQAGVDLCGSDPLGIRAALSELLGRGSGRCLEIGCGTGANAPVIRGLGWTPIGVDLSAPMLRYSGDRLPVAQADAAHLPLRDATVPTAVAVMVHTDMPAYPRVVREVSRVLHSGGTFVHIGIHPCFCGSFANRAKATEILIRPGYLTPHHTRTSWTTAGLRSKVGAVHRPLPDLLHAIVDAGLTLERFTEGGQPTPVVLAIRARK